ncbi:hypothetical protein MRX96_026876 [Rhipicephalus microplus]
MIFATKFLSPSLVALCQQHFVAVPNCVASDTAYKRPPQRGADSRTRATLRNLVTQRGREPTTRKPKHRWPRQASGPYRLIPGARATRSNFAACPEPTTGREQQQQSRAKSGANSPFSFVFSAVAAAEATATGRAATPLFVAAARSANPITSSTSSSPALRARVPLERASLLFSPLVFRLRCRRQQQRPLLPIPLCAYIQLEAEKASNARHVPSPVSAERRPRSH